jgi:hypothetical protein
MDNDTTLKTGKRNPLPVQSLQTKWRDSFPGTSLDATKWNVIQQDAGTGYSVSGGVLNITTGTNANAQIVLETVDAFTNPLRVLASLMLSQKIANQEFFLEIVSVDPVTLQADGLDAAAWRISYDDNTSTTYAVYEVQVDGNARLASSAQNISNSQTAFNLYEIELFPDECWFHTRALDSAGGRSYSAVRHQQIPGPNRLYKIRLRAHNKSTAPGSSTTFSFQFVNVVCFAELTAEITAGRGSSNAGQSIAVQIANGRSDWTVKLDANTTPYTDTTTNLGASATYTGSTRDTGSSYNAYNRFRVCVAHTAGNGHGHLVIEQSTDNSTWRETHRRPVPSDGLYRTYDFAICMRYVRVKFINGATAQTQFFLSSALVRVDGNTDISRNDWFLHTTTALGAGAPFNGVTLDLGGNHEYKSHRAVAFADQSGTLNLQESRDGATWRTVATQAVSANTPAVLEARITMRYVRVQYTNGGTAQTTFELTSSLLQ